MAASRFRGRNCAWRPEHLFGWQQVAIISNLTGITDEAALLASGNLLVA